MSAEIKIGTESCNSTIEHETAGILRCESSHEPYLPFPGTHGAGPLGWHDGDSRIVPAERPPWRFDVPEVPAHVTAFRDCDGEVWLRLTDGTWSLEPIKKGGMAEIELWAAAPLVECEDPRTVS